MNFTFLRVLANKLFGLFLLTLLGTTFLNFLITEKAYAAQRDYQDFICLFTAKERDCSHAATPEQVKRAEESGLAYGKVTTSGVTPTGIKEILTLIGLHSRPYKDMNDGPNSTSRYFYKRVGENDSGGEFFIRLKYTIPPGEKFSSGDTPSSTERIIYQTEAIPYAEHNNTTTYGITEITSSETATGDAYTDGKLTSISFYKERSGGDLLIEKQVVQHNLKFINEIPFGSKIKIDADLWYCGGESGNGVDVDGRDAPKSDRVEYFTTDGNWKEDDDGLYDPSQNNNGVTYVPRTGGIKYNRTLCGAESAFKIGDTIQIVLPSSKEEAVDQTKEEVNSGVLSTQYTGSVMPQCHILNGWGPGSGSFLACISNTFYYLVFQPIAWFAWLMGQIFDFFIGYSLSDEAYRHVFVQTGWQLVRDISNIFFILIMVWSGLMAVFKTSNVSYKKVIPTLIINALIINFSLFATRVVIDISNITARLFYDRINVCETNDTGECSNLSGPGGFKSVSASIVSSFNPQRILQNSNILNVPSEPDFDPDPDKDTVANSTENPTGDFNSVQTTGTKNAAGMSRTSTEYAAYFGLITLIMVMVAFGTAMMFWKTAFMFVGRVIGLYVAMIFSPFAFLSRDKVPLVGNIPGINYSSWMKDLINYTLLAPIFVFFLYIINAFLKADFIQGLGLQQNTSNFFEAALYVVIPMLIIYGLISRGVGIAKNLAGTYGNMAQEFMGKAAGVVVGGALGIATGGTAVAGRNIIGRLGTRLASSQSLQNASSRGGIRGALADRVIRSGSYLSRSNYDARNVRFINNRLREVGATNTRIGGLLGTNQSDTAGGFQGAINREVASQNARADRMLVTGRQAAAQDARNTAWENAYQTARNTAQQAANNAGTPFDETAFRTNYLTTQAGVGNARPQTTAEINRQREQQNNARLARRSMIQRIANRATNRVTTPAGVGGAATSGAGLAAGAATAAITGAATVAAATIVGQGAIQNAAQEQVARQRAGNARNPLSASQITNLQNKLNQLQAELTRRIALMNNIGGTLNPPVTFANLTPANVIDYQADRQRDIDSLQTQIDAEQDYVDRNKNNPTLTNQVNTARSTIRTLSNKQATARNNMRQAGTILSEFNRIQTDIDETRKKLGI